MLTLLTVLHDHLLSELSRPSFPDQVTIGTVQSKLQTSLNKPQINTECLLHRVPEHGSGQDVPADDGFLCDKTAVLRDMIKGTTCNKHTQSNVDTNNNHTGRFIICSGITKNYCRKTVGHVFTKPVKTE